MKRGSKIEEEVAKRNKLGYLGFQGKPEIKKFTWICSFCKKEYIWQHQAKQCEKNHFCGGCDKPFVIENEGVLFGKEKFHKSCLKELLLKVGDTFAIKELGLDDEKEEDEDES